jgi:UDP-N-acetyl-2-amino-2-deoxyglucuronate dehydrogenase
MINVGIIGGGNISESHARAVHETDGVQVAAVYGRNTDKASRLAELYGGTVHTEMDSLLAHRPLDMVFIGSPSGLHAEQGIAAARHGLHVLVEKPIDITTQRAGELIAQCEESQVKLAVCFQDRVASDLRELKQFLVDGKLGNPILVTGKVKWYRPAEYYGASQWRGTKALDGGGALINQGVHTIDLLLWMLGPVTRVHAISRTALHKIEVEDTLVATLEFAGGAIGTFEASTAAYPGYNRRVELTGSEGTVILENSSVVQIDLRDRDSARLLRSSDENRNASSTSAVVSDISGHKRLLEDFVRSIETGSQPACDGREGRRSIALVEALYESASTRSAVTLS